MFFTNLFLGFLFTAETLSARLFVCPHHTVFLGEKEQECKLSGVFASFLAKTKTKTYKKRPRKLRSLSMKSESRINKSST